MRRPPSQLHLNRFGFALVAALALGVARTPAQEGPTLPPDGGKEQLARAVARVDRLDPVWTSAGIEASRHRPDPGKNSAEVLDATRGRFLPATNVEREALYAACPPESCRPLTPDARAKIAAVVGRNRATLPALRGLVDRPTGRFRLSIPLNGLDTPLPHLQPLRKQVDLLLADAVLRLDGGDADGALASCRAALCAARSLFDEPFILSQFVRVACDGQTQQIVRRVLELGRPSDAGLAATQLLLDDEADQPLALVALRGERAVMHELFGHLADGSLRIDDINRKNDPRAEKFDDAFQEDLVRSGLYRVSQALMLETMTRLVDVARKPPQTWSAGIEQFQQSWEADAKLDPKRFPEKVLPNLLVPAATPVLRGELRTDALGRALVLLIAADRYALAHGRRPGSASDLVPKTLKSVPVDPMTGGPMRLVTKAGTVIAYSPGVDGRDDGGEVAGSSTQGVEKSRDVGFTLSRPRTR